MPEVIQFACPACGTNLRVPLAAAGFQGPCPRCSQLIIGPDPLLDQEARLATSLTPQPRPSVPLNPARDNDPFNPFQKFSRPSVPAASSAPPVIPPAAPVPEPLAPPVPPPVPEALKPPLPQLVALPLPEPAAPVPPDAAALPLAEPEAVNADLPSLDPEAFESLPPPAPSSSAPASSALPEALPDLETLPFTEISAPLPREPDSGAEKLPPPAVESASPDRRPAQPAQPSRAVLILSCAVATLSGLVAGYLFGLLGPRPAFAENRIEKSAPPPARLPVTLPVAAEPPTVIPATPQPEQSPPSPDNAPPVDAPMPVNPPPAPKETPPTILPAAEAALKAFLAAPDWKSRALHVLHPETTTAKMEAYHATAPDGPTPVLSLRADASHGGGEKDSNLLSYLITTEAQPAGFPVAVVETSDGWKVDWESFVEFRDDHFGRFAAGQGGEAGAFHVLVRNTHYFGEPFPGSDLLSAFRLDPPLPDRNHYAFVPTGSELHKTLAGATEWGRPCAPVLQLVRKPHGEREFHIEIEAILAPNWRPNP